MSSSTRKPRKYAPAWEAIKKHGRVTLAVPPPLFPMVVKAVIKEKHQDLGFKCLNDHDSFKLLITRDPAAGRITFVLKQKLGLEGVKL